MKKRPRETVAFIVLLAAVVWVLAPRPQPSWNGLPISEWVADLGQIDGGFLNRTGTKHSHDAITEAVKQTGPRGQEWLERELHSEDSPLKLWVQRWLAKQKFWKIAFTPSAQRKFRAMWMLKIFPPKNRAAISRLVELLDDPECSRMAAQVLVRSGADAKAALTTALHSRNVHTQLAVLNAEQEVWNKVPLPPTSVLPLLTNAHIELRREAASVLGNAANYPAELVVPGLTAALDDVDLEVRRSAAFSLIVFGKAIKPAVPKLQALLANDPNYSMRESAHQVLRVVFPEALPTTP